MLAKLADTLPVADGYLFEPKWDGFRAIVFRGGPDEIHIQSRDLKPLDRYFPELRPALLDTLPDGCVVDGEIVIATDGGLDFDALQMRLHLAASRVAKLADATPASFVTFDLLAADGADLTGASQAERRARSSGSSRARRRRSTSRRLRATATKRSAGWSASRERAWTASSPSRRAQRISRASVPC
jgi:ATP-dependent DNA ligase